MKKTNGDAVVRCVARLTSQRCSFERGLVDGGDWSLIGSSSSLVRSLA